MKLAGFGDLVGFATSSVSEQLSVSTQIKTFCNVSDIIFYFMLLGFERLWMLQHNKVGANEWYQHGVNGDCQFYIISINWILCNLNHCRTVLNVDSRRPNNRTNISQSFFWEEHCNVTVCQGGFHKSASEGRFEEQEDNEVLADWAKLPTGEVSLLPVDCIDRQLAAAAVPGEPLQPPDVPTLLARAGISTRCRRSNTGVGKPSSCSFHCSLIRQFQVIDTFRISLCRYITLLSVCTTQPTQERGILCRM